MFIYFNERLSSQRRKCIFAVLHSISQQQCSFDSYIELHFKYTNVCVIGSLIFARRGLTMRSLCENTRSTVAGVQNIFGRSGRCRVIQQKRAFPHLEEGIP